MVRDAEYSKDPKADAAVAVCLAGTGETETRTGASEGHTTNRGEAGPACSLIIKLYVCRPCL